ncbi:MAG: hypothetical protein WDN48_16720 [Pseudolabrys sp.]
MRLDEIGEQRRDKQQRDCPPPEQQNKNEIQSSAGIPRRDAEIRVGLDEADPIEQQVARQIGQADGA